MVMVAMMEEELCSFWQMRQLHSPNIMKPSSWGLAEMNGHWTTLRLLGPVTLGQLFVNQHVNQHEPELFCVTPCNEIYFSTF